MWYNIIEVNLQCWSDSILYSPAWFNRKVPQAHVKHSHPVNSMCCNISGRTSFNLPKSFEPCSLWFRIHFDFEETNKPSMEVFVFLVFRWPHGGALTLWTSVCLKEQGPAGRADIYYNITLEALKTWKQLLNTATAGEIHLFLKKKKKGADSLELVMKLKRKRKRWGGAPGRPICRFLH